MLTTLDGNLYPHGPEQHDNEITEDTFYHIYSCNRIDADRFGIPFFKKRHSKVHVSIFLIQLIPKIAAILLSFSFKFTLIIYASAEFKWTFFSWNEVLRDNYHNDKICRQFGTTCIGTVRPLNNSGLAPVVQKVNNAIIHRIDFYPLCSTIGFTKGPTTLPGLHLFKARVILCTLFALSSNCHTCYNAVIWIGFIGKYIIVTMIIIMIMVMITIIIIIIIRFVIRFAPTVKSNLTINGVFSGPENLAGLTGGWEIGLLLPHFGRQWTIMWHLKLIIRGFITKFTHTRNRKAIEPIIFSIWLPNTYKSTIEVESLTTSQQRGFLLWLGKIYVRSSTMARVHILTTTKRLLVYLGCSVVG